MYNLDSGLQILFALVGLSFILAYLLSYAYPEFKPGKIFVIFILIIAGFTLLTLQSINDDLNRSYDIVYGIDSDFDGFPDESANVLEMDNLVYNLAHGVGYQSQFTLLSLLAIITIPIGVTIQVISEDFLEKQNIIYKTTWRRIVLTATIAIIILLLGLAFYSIIWDTAVLPNY